MAQLLDREEYIEQAYFYRTLNERMQQGMSTQELLLAVRQELLATAKLPLALDFLRTELKHTGGFATAMARMDHYFTAFQTFVIREAERQEGRFDFRIALEILEREAKYRSENATRQGIFFFQFEALCRNRLGYDAGLEAMAADPVYDEAWGQWILTVRRQVGLIDLADMVYVRSEYYRMTHEDMDRAVLFGEKEGKIALANRRKDPVYLFSALARHLGYPSVPRPKPPTDEENLVPLLRQRIERLEMRVRLMEEELRGGINLARFFVSDSENKGS
ncbi:MAG: hypothetical protein PHO07_06540 [Pirellulales bacterium]|jgi:hypothetical protein|nr:hypothetical protein [Thermoguttaceae bacterium]MDD4786816.1 hypothetical protein [Pirellulales bacterium]NLZ00476.1 hypothetical protein [Pirellulaceae bacterium]